MSDFNVNTPEFWIIKALEHYQVNDLRTAKSFAQQAHKMDKDNIEYSFIYILTLLDTSRDLSLFQYKNNLEEINLVMKELRNKRANGLMIKQQEDKFVELSRKNYEYLEFVHDVEFRLDNMF